MPRTHPAYPPEFRHQVLELVRSGRSPAELARDFECSADTIRKWVRQAGLDEGRSDAGLTTDDRDELRRLRRQNLQLRLERDILAKATAWLCVQRRRTRSAGVSPAKVRARVL